MIRVNLPSVPANFQTAVRTPGLAFLASTPHPTSDDWRRHRYWKHVHDYLYTGMKGVCAYSSAFTPRRRSRRSIDHTSIDHYIAKSLGNHAQAYEWDNLRLCRSVLNNRKGDYTDVLDPCAIQDRWFQLDFVTFALLPNATLPVDHQNQIRASIARLELNIDDAYVNERARAVYTYADGALPMIDLQRLYPFIAAEMVAQNFDSAHLPNFRTALSSPKMRAALIRQGVVVA